MVSRALLAFQVGEREPSDARLFSEDADLGALIVNDHYDDVRYIRHWLRAFGEARAEAAEELAKANRK